VPCLRGRNAFYFSGPRAAVISRRTAAVPCLRPRSCHADGPTGFPGSPEHIGNGQRNGASVRLEHGGDLRDPLDHRAAIGGDVGQRSPVGDVAPAGGPAR
jgi:hypothetical protein